MQGAINFSDDGYLADFKINAWVNFLSQVGRLKKGFFFPKSKTRGLESLFSVMSLVDHIDKYELI